MLFPYGEESSSVFNLRRWINNIEELHGSSRHPPDDHLLSIRGPHPNGGPGPDGRVVPRHVTSGIASRPSGGCYRTRRGRIKAPCLSLGIPYPKGLAQILRFAVMPIVLAILTYPRWIQIARIPRQSPWHHRGLFSIALLQERRLFGGHPVGPFTVCCVKLQSVYVW